ncbi:MAG TPA: MBL fold metallo-hydrolase [Candidatus Angelobacter sp.]
MFLHFLRRSLSVWYCLIFVLLAIAQSPAAVHKIADNLYAYISENDSSANSTFLITREGILVVDTGLNEAEGRKILGEIRKLSALPIRYVVNTHYHPDHRGGNSVFGPGATIISTAFTLQKSGSGPSAAGTDRIAIQDSIEIFLGGSEIRIYFPGPAHTMGDAVVYFPQQHAIATGDLFLNHSCPAMDQGDMENWIAALDSMLKLPLDAVVPGHFELASKEELRRFRDYLAALRDQVEPMYRAGVPLNEVVKRLDMSKYEDFRQYPQYEATFGDNARTYYRQLQQRSRRSEPKPKLHHPSATVAFR